MGGLMVATGQGGEISGISRYRVIGLLGYRDSEILEYRRYRM